MGTSNGKSLPTLGFLTVVDDGQEGMLGGFLVLNTRGRPVEFHCTTPVKPNRAQVILFGPTLEPYLYGEQIGQTLLAKSTTTPLAVYTDLAAVLAVRDFISLPVAMVLPDESSIEHLASNQTDIDRPNDEVGRLAGDPGHRTVAQPGVGPLRLDSAHHSPEGMHVFSQWNHRLAVLRSRSDDESVISHQVATAVEAMDLLEPFDRIRGAIAEAQRSRR